MVLTTVPVNYRIQVYKSQQVAINKFRWLYFIYLKKKNNIYFKKQTEQTETTLEQQNFRGWRTEM